MVFWGFMRRASFWFIGLISLVAVLVTQLVMPSPDHAATLYPPLLRLLIIPGHTNIWEIFYPVVPWLGATGLGLLFGELLKRDTHRAGRVAGWTGLGFLALFVIVRTTGGFGNLNEVPARMDRFFKRDQVSAQSGFFDDYAGDQSLVNGYVGVGRTTSSKPIPSLAGIWPGGAIFLSAASMGLQPTRIVF